MKRALFILTILALLLPLTAFAEGPQEGDYQAVAAETPQQNFFILGEQIEFAFFVIDPFGFPIPDFPVDIRLYRPSTEFGWPLFQAQTPGTGYLIVGESEMRRQSWPAYQATNEFGLYYAKFMLPRDNVWYPCGYPCRWECDFYDPFTDTWERHSPLVVVDLYKSFEDWLFAPLYWPWIAPADTVHPMEAWAFEGGTWYVLGGGVWELEIDGYFWKTSDLEVDYPADWPFICPWMLP